jgi:hypothetical protein
MRMKVFAIAYLMTWLFLTATAPAATGAVNVSSGGIQFPDNSVQSKACVLPACSSGEVLVSNSGSWYCGSVMPVTNGVATCAQSVCATSACLQGFGDCDHTLANGCETPLTTVQNCGACGNGCVGLQTCTSGACAGTTQFSFVQQPTNSLLNTSISPAVTIQLQDAGGNPVSSAGIPITIALTTPAGAVLSGTLTQLTNASGVATFNDLKIDKLGSYTLSASNPSLPSVTSNPFTIAAYFLPTTATDISLGAKSVLVNGTRAYIIEGTVFKVLDVSNPLSPVLLGSVTHGFTDLRVEAHAIYNNIVWCVRSSSGGYGAATYVFGVDVSNPASPVVRGSLTLQAGSSLLANVSLIYAGNLLVHDYSRNLIYVINISNPDAPAVYSSWSVPNMVNGGPGNMLIEGTLLYLPCGENSTFRIYNLSNLASVVQVGSVATGAQSYGPAVKIGNYVYMTASSNLKVIDVSTPSNPTIVGSVTSTGYLKERNGKLFSFSSTKISAYSLANPIGPVVEASSTVTIPAPSTSLELSPMTSPAATWVGNYLIGMTYGSATQYNGARSLNFPVN